MSYDQLSRRTPRARRRLSFGWVDTIIPVWITIGWLVGPAPLARGRPGGRHLANALVM